MENEMDTGVKCRDIGQSNGNYYIGVMRSYTQQLLDTAEDTSRARQITCLQKRSMSSCASQENAYASLSHHKRIKCVLQQQQQQQQLYLQLQLQFVAFLHQGA